MSTENVGFDAAKRYARQASQRRDGPSVHHAGSHLVHAVAAADRDARGRGDAGGSGGGGGRRKKRGGGGKIASERSTIAQSAKTKTTMKQRSNDATDGIDTTSIGAGSSGGGGGGSGGSGGGGGRPGRRSDAQLKQIGERMRMLELRFSNTNSQGTSGTASSGPRANAQAQAALAARRKHAAAAGAIPKSPGDGGAVVAAARAPLAPPSPPLPSAHTGTDMDTATESDAMHLSGEFERDGAWRAVATYGADRKRKQLRQQQEQQQQREQLQPQQRADVAAMAHGATSPRTFAPFTTPSERALVDPATLPSAAFTQSDENDCAQVVLLHAPQLANWMGGLHPCGSLYERPVRLEDALAEHEEFQRKLRAAGVSVLTVYEVLIQDCDEDVVARISLEQLAFGCLTYALADESDRANLTETELYYLSDEYKLECLDKMDKRQLADIVLTHPTIYLTKADKDTELLTTRTSFNALANLVFTRDQQLTTCKGIVMGRLASEMRAREVNVMKYCFAKLGIPVIGEIRAPGRIEGGDFLPAGRDLCFVGIGMRSNIAAVRQMLDEKLFGTTRVAVVKDFFDQDQQRMHLDTVCNIVNPKVMIILEDICGKDSPWRRLVDEYVLGDNGEYRLHRHDIEFSEYLRGEGYQLIPLTNQMQYDYGCNCLNLGDGLCFMVDMSAAKRVAANPSFNGRIVHVNFSSMSTMYGSVHCCSQVISRRNGVASEALAMKSGDDAAASHSTVCTVSAPSALSGSAARSKKPQRGGKKGSTANKAEARDEAAAMRPPQSFSKLFMVAPNNFYVNPQSLPHNKQMQWFASLEAVREGHADRRQLRGHIVREYAALHALLTVELGVEVHLFSHDHEEGIPEAVFCADIVSMHSARECKSGKPTAVLYSLFIESRRREKRAQFLQQAVLPNASAFVDFSPCERDAAASARHSLQVANFVRAAAEADADAAAEHTDTDRAADGHKANLAHGKYLEGDVITFDRVNRIAYVQLCKRADRELARAVSDALGYELVAFHPEDDDETTPCVFVGTHCVIFCGEFIPDASERAAVRASLLGDAQRTLIEISVEQTLAWCAAGLEVLDREGTPTIVLSDEAYDAFTSAQLRAIEETGTSIRRIALTHIQTAGGGGVSSLAVECPE